jgi:hypothetical protein
MLYELSYCHSVEKEYLFSELVCPYNLKYQNVQKIKVQTKKINLQKINEQNTYTERFIPQCKLSEEG